MRQYITQMTLLSYGPFHNQIAICIKKKFSSIYKIKDEIHWEHQLLLFWVWLAKRHCKTTLFYKSASHHSCNHPSSDLLSTYCAGTGTNNVAFGYLSNLFCHALAWVSRPATLSHFNVSKSNTTCLSCFKVFAHKSFSYLGKLSFPFWAWKNSAQMSITNSKKSSLRALAGWDHTTTLSEDPFL